VLDIECPTASTQANSQPDCEHSGDSGWVDSATMAQRVFDWLAMVQAASGRTPIIYSYSSWFANAAFTDARLAGFPLFVATYGSCASVPAPWTQALFWQYSATGTVPGIAATTDLDRFFGTPDDLTGLTGPMPDAGVGGGSSGSGCGCRSDSGAPSWIAVLALAAVARRRSRR
jgi:MYXO-CTERM domain-containing protein